MRRRFALSWTEIAPLGFDGASAGWDYYLACADRIPPRHHRRQLIQLRG
jgi:hypothetical protein